MRYNAYKYLILTVLVLALTPSFAQKKKKDKLPEKARIEFTNAFIEGNKQKVLENYELAAALFSKCIEIDENSAAAMYELSNLYAIQKDYTGAMMFAKKAVDIAPENIWYQYLLAQIYEKTGLLTKSADIYKGLIKSNPYKTELYYQLGTIYTAIGKLNDAIKTYDALEKKVGISEEISIEKERLYLAQDKKSKAAEEIKKLIAEYPNEPRYYGLLAEIYSDMGMKEKALETYEEILKIDAENGLIHLSLAEYYRVDKQYEKSFDHLQKAYRSTDVNVDIKIKMMLNFLPYANQNEKSRNEGETLIEILRETYPDDIKVATIYADYLLIIEEYEEARDQYRKVVQVEKNKYIIWEQLLLLENQLSDYQGMYDESKEAINYFPNQTIIFLFNGIAAHQLKKYPEAIESFENGLPMVVDNQALEAQFYTYLGEVFNDTKNYIKSDKAFDKLLKLEPNNQHVLNNYSYYLSLRGDSLLKAEKMITKCVEAEPNNDTFLDTYAWVLYRLGKYEKAKEAVEKAIELGGDKSAVVIEHYGDILYQLNEKEKAIEQWNKALKVGKGSEHLEEKVEQKMLIE